MLNIHKLRCVGGSEVVKTCTDQRCGELPLMCSASKCKCLELHKNCHQTHEIQSLVSQLIQKTGILKRPFDSIIHWYSNCVKLINLERDQLLRKINFLVERLLDTNQVKFLQVLQDGKSRKITGQTMKKFIYSLQKPLSNAVLTFEEQVRGQLTKINKQLQYHLDKVRQCWETQKQDKQILQKVKKCAIKWTWLNGKWIKPVPNEFHLSDLTGLGLDFLDTNVINILASSCPRLQGLQVGYWVTNSNFDDSCAQTISQSLPFLKRLWIYNSPLTDKGAIQISSSLKVLQYLILNNCKLTAVGKSQVRRMLPQCKKIQLL